MAATTSQKPDELDEGSPSASGLLESGGYLVLTPREGAPDFSASFTLDYDAGLEEYTLHYPSPNTPQNVAAEDARQLLAECARLYIIEYIPD